MTSPNIKTTYNRETKIWSGPEIPRNYETGTSLGKELLAALLEHSTKIGQICYHNGKEYTNKELAALSISVAHHFSELGLQQGDVIGICASYTDFLAPLFFGAIFKNLIVNNLDESYDKACLKHIFGKTKPKLMFCDGGIYERVREALQESGLNIEIYTMKEHKEGQPNIDEFLNGKKETFDYPFEPLKMGLSQTAAIICSSGTTGLPKCVTISQEDLLEHKTRKFSTSGRYLCLSTLHWISGLIILLATTFSGMTRIISDKAIFAEDFFNIIQKYRVTSLSVSHSQMAMMLSSPQLRTSDLSSITSFVCAGNVVPYAMAKKIKEFMPNAIFRNVYGMTELRMCIAVGQLLEKPGLIGDLSSNIQIKILNDDGQKLEPNQVGEIYCKTPRKWSGYYGNEKATAATYDADGWIATGDMGYIDEGNKLYILDRKHNILKYKSFPYYPTEIEQVIHELDDIVDVCVFGVPDANSIDLPAAAVVKKIGSDLKAEDIYEHVAQRMDFSKLLRGGVYFLDKLPLTFTGKILAKEVKSICEKLQLEQKPNN